MVQASTAADIAAADAAVAAAAAAAAKRHALYQLYDTLPSQPPLCPMQVPVVVAAVFGAQGRGRASARTVLAQGSAVLAWAQGCDPTRARSVLTHGPLRLQGAALLAWAQGCGRTSARSVP